MNLKILNVQAQEPLPHISLPANWHPAANPDQYTLTISGGIYRYKKAAHTPPPPHSSKSPMLDIKVIEDAYIIIELDSKTNWHWTPTNAITTADRNQSDYFNLGYWDGYGWHAVASQPCRIIRFAARRRPDLPDNYAFPFNMNIEMEAADGVMPITIDPDIRNPGTLPLPAGRKRKRAG